MELELTAEKREQTGTKAVRALRERGLLPAVLYGGKEDAEHISVATSDFLKVWQRAGESTVITLTGLEKKKTVLIQDVALHPLYDTPLHVDFLAVRSDEEVEVEIPIVFTGVAPAEKELGGNLVKVMHEITVRAFPQNLPHEIEADISHLKTFNDHLLVEHITLPDGVTAVTDAKEVIALVQEQKEEQEASEEAPDLSAVEVEKKGKEEEAE